MTLCDYLVEKSMMHFTPGMNGAHIAYCLQAVNIHEGLCLPLFVHAAPSVLFQEQKPGSETRINNCCFVPCAN